MENNAKKIAELLKVLANENRLLILCALLDGQKNVTEIGEYVQGISQSALSQHLAILKANRILNNKKTGLNITYFISDERVKEVMSVLEKYYCKIER